MVVVGAWQRFPHRETNVTIRFFQQSIELLASAGDTHGVVGAIEVISPRGAAPPLHVHHAEDEAFYVIEGDYTIRIGDDVVTGAPGTWVWGPRDVPHGYEVHSERGRHLSLTVPGGFEAFFQEVADMAEPSADPRSVMGQLAAVAARYGVEFLGSRR
jgi:quercetin dioxygenase-like cupin family protein